MKSIFTIMSIFVISMLNAQQINPDLTSVIEAIANTDTIKIYRFESFQQNKPLYILDSLATDEELVYLIKNGAAATRIQASYLLQKRAEYFELKSNINYGELFVNNYLNEEHIQLSLIGYETQFIYSTVANWFAQVIGNYRGDFQRYLPFPRVSVDNDTQFFIDSLMISNETSLHREMETAVLSIPIYPSLHEPAKARFLQKKNDDNLLIYLSRFQKEEDIELVINNLPITKFRSNVPKKWVPLNNFQHPRLFDYLKDSVEVFWKERGYISAVAKYQSKDAASLLNIIYQKAKNDKKRRNLITMIRYNLEPNFVEDYADLWIKILSENAPFGYLRLPDEIWSFRGDTLYSLYEKWRVEDSKWAKRDAEYLFPNAQKFMEDNYPQKMVQTILNNIRLSTDFKKIPESFVYIINNRNPLFVDPLLKIMQEEAEGSQRFFLAKLILDFNQPNIADKIVTFFEKNPSMIPTIREAESGGHIYSTMNKKAIEKKEK